MTFDSNIETVAILYDIENAPFEMLDYTLGKARKYIPCRMIVASDWENRPEQKCWNRLLRREGFTFRQIDRKVDGKNSLDYALFDTAIMLRDEGVRKFFIITTDSDFAKIAQVLKKGSVSSYLIGVGTSQASQVLRDAYDEFICYPPEKKKTSKLVPVQKNSRQDNIVQEKNQGLRYQVDGTMQIKLPKTLQKQLLQRMEAENVGFDQLITYLLMRGLSQ